jgi:hypothetical protein
MKDKPVTRLKNLMKFPANKPLALASDLLIGVHHNWRAKSTHNCVKEGGLLLYLAWATNKQCRVRVAKFFFGPNVGIVVCCQRLAGSVAAPEVPRASISRVGVSGKGRCGKINFSFPSDFQFEE